MKYEREMRDFPGSQVVKTVLPVQGIWVQSLVRELRSHMPRSKAKKYIKIIKKKKEREMINGF